MNSVEKARALLDELSEIEEAIKHVREDSRLIKQQYRQQMMANNTTLNELLEERFEKVHEAMEYYSINEIAANLGMNQSSVLAFSQRNKRRHYTGSSYLQPANC